MAGVTGEGQTTDSLPHSALLPFLQEAHLEIHQQTHSPLLGLLTAQVAWASFPLRLGAPERGGGVLILL